MVRLNSVLGSIKPDDLGFTLMHEHILVVNSALCQAFPALMNRDEVIRKAVEEIKAAKEYGVNTIVDVTPINLGRDIQLIREVAEKADIQVIASTGFYHTEESFLSYWEKDWLIELLLPDIQRGIQGTDIKAGVIKCATGEHGVTDTNRKLLQVAAGLHRLTGVPIITHSEAKMKNGLDQQDVFEKEEVDLTRVVIGHCGDTDDLEYIEAVLKRGSYVGMDRFGEEPIFPNEKRIDTLAKLCEIGYDDRIVVSHDYNIFIDWLPPDKWKDYKVNMLPERSYHHIIKDIIPALIEKGVSEKQIQRITVENPRQIFEKQGIN